MNTNEQPVPDALPLFYANQARLRHWWDKLERFKAIQGARARLGHVSDLQWLAYYAANEDAFDAVVSELEKVGD